MKKALVFFVISIALVTLLSGCRGSGTNSSTEQPTATVEPASSIEPTGTTSPVNAVKPGSTVKPVTTAKPASTSAPVSTVQPISTVNPIITAEPVITVKPVTHNTVNVSMTGYQFSPKIITINIGDTVIWTNNDSAGHDVNGTGFVSPTMNKGQTFSFTFNNSGTFDYICNFHSGMSGQVIVK